MEGRHVGSMSAESMIEGTSGNETLGGDQVRLNTGMVFVPEPV